MALSASRVAARHLASTGAECEFFKATDGKWYMGLEDYRSWDDDEDDDGDRDADMKYYGPFPSLKAAIKYLNDNFANPGGWSEDDSGRQKPPRKPIKPSGGFSWKPNRWAFNKFNPDELLGQLVAVLEKEGLEDAVKAVKKVTPDIQKAWRARPKTAGSAPDGWDVAKIYMHLSNGGATLRVVDAGNGPEFHVEIGSFGMMDSEIRFETSPEGLRRIGEMLLYAAGHEGYSQHYDASGGLQLPDVDREMPLYWKKQLFKSLEDSLRWWDDRERQAGLKPV
jgi:hypothetical protein